LNNLVIFDGVCNFCTKSIRFILRHEADNIIKFTPLQSLTGSKLMREFGVDPNNAETFIFVSDGRALTKSDAALALANHLRGGWRIVRVFRFLPRSVRDRAYGILARNRYRWFGRYDTCMVPSPEIRDRFIND
jgi:predicted DCC family thiol-disulfide oxidoreductase YuxK